MTRSRLRIGASTAGFSAGLAFALVVLGRCAFLRTVPARLDLADFFWPLKSYTAARWAAGAVPLWNPLSGCGEPWLAQLQTGVFYPGDLPFLLKWPYGPLVAIALHLAIAAAGMSAWLWDLGASRAAGVLSALVYAGGGAFLSLVPVYNNACSAAYIPWIFLGARRLARGESVVTLTASSALAFLAGEPGLALGAVASGVLVALATRREGEPGPAQPVRRTGIRVAGACLLAVGLVAVTLLPFVELVRETGRLFSITAEEAVARPVGASELGDLVLPLDAEAAASFRPDRGYLLSLALGPAPLLLACGCAAGFPGRRRLLTLLLILGVLGALVSLGAAGFLAPALHRIGLLRMRFPARWFVFTHLFLAVAAGAGLDGWFYGRFTSPRPEPTRDGEVPSPADEGVHAAWPALTWAIGGAVVIFLLLMVATRDLEQRRGVRLFFVAGSGLATAAALTWTRFGKGGQRLAGGVVLAAVVPLVPLAGDPLAAARGRDLVAPPPAVFATASPPSGRLFSALHVPSVLAEWMASQGATWRPELAARAHAALAGYANLTHGVATPMSPSPVGNPRVARLLGAGVAAGGNTAAVLALADVGAIVTPFPTRIAGALLERRKGEVSLYALPGRAGRVFFAKSVEVADDDAAFAALRRSDLDPEARAFVADPGIPLPSGKAGPGYAVARIDLDAPEELRVSLASSRPGFVVITRSFDPSWSATLDGAPLRAVRTDLAFMGLAVPAGDHRLVLRYRPLSFRIGAWVSGASALVFLAFWLAGGPAR